MKLALQLIGSRIVLFCSFLSLEKFAGKTLGIGDFHISGNNLFRIYGKCSKNVETIFFNFWLHTYMLYPYKTKLFLQGKT